VEVVLAVMLLLETYLITEHLLLLIQEAVAEAIEVEL